MADDARPPESPGPADLSSRTVREEARKAVVWLGMALLIVGVIFLAQPIMLIIGGMVFAVLLDGGTRLLGRVLPIARGWRLAIVIISGFAFIGWVLWFAGSTFVGQFEALRLVVSAQFDRVMAWADEMGFIQEGSAASLGQQVLGSVGRLTSAVSTALGALASGLLIIVIGIFIAVEPRLYDRGVAWMLPVERRAHFYAISDKVGFTLRRLLAGRVLAMLFEGIATWIMLMLGGVPMAALLGLITGLLAFIPNIGALISGILMVAVGFSAGTGQGLWAIFVYFFVQNVDAYLVVPYIARKTVDLAPALVLAAQLIFGALFGFLGLLLADPIMATLKVALEKISETSPKPEVREAARRSRSPAAKKQA
ncbi:MAG TPA: AI-2E family transporter [Sphingomicrobium sp.]|nr:AI-2E family transporter [Sphingomicrobium sp.]